MQNLTFENAVCFGIGMAVVYMMFRAMGVFVVALLFTLTLSVHAQTNFVLVENLDPLPVVVTAASTPNYWPATAAGFGFGLTVCGFGWVIRMARKTTSDF